MFESDAAESRAESEAHNQLAVQAAQASTALEPDLAKYQYTLFTTQMSLGVVLRLNKKLDQAAQILSRLF